MSNGRIWTEDLLTTNTGLPFKSSNWVTRRTTPSSIRANSGSWVALCFSSHCARKRSRSARHSAGASTLRACPGRPLASANPSPRYRSTNSASEITLTLSSLVRSPSDGIGVRGAAGRSCHRSDFAGNCSAAIDRRRCLFVLGHVRGKGDAGIFRKVGFCDGEGHALKRGQRI